MSGARPLPPKGGGRAAWHPRTEAFLLRPLTPALLEEMRAALAVPPPRYRFMRAIEFFLADNDARVRAELATCVAYATAVCDVQECFAALAV